MDLSFPTIAASGCNGAIAHYFPQSDTCRILSKDDIFLMDSGGQVRYETDLINRLDKVAEMKVLNYLSNPFLGHVSALNF